MCSRLVLLLTVLPVLLFGENHAVPPGTSGNRIVLSVHNAGVLPLKDATVVVTQCPPWVAVSEQIISIPEIAPSQKEEAVVVFETTIGEAGLHGLLVLQILDNKNNLLAEKEYTLVSTLDQATESLLSVYPNPANPSTTVPFIVTEESHVKIEVFNMLGQRVCSLLDENRAAGKWQVAWDGRNAHGIPVASGTYIIRMQVKGKHGLKQNTTKILLQK